MVDTTAPNTKDIARPWKMGSNNIMAAPITTAPVVSKMGVVLTAPASIMACLIGSPCRSLIWLSLPKPYFDKVNQQHRVSYHNPGKCYHAYKRSSGKVGAQ